MRILYLEDDKTVATATLRILKKEHTVEWAENIRQATIDTRSNSFDLFILDISLPDGDGVDFCKFLREEKQLSSPVLVLTAHDSKELTTQALDAGADDYLVKPYNAGELQARIRALGRRGKTPISNKFVIGNTIIDLSKRVVSINGRDLILRKKEFEILTYLVKNLNNACSRSDLYEQIWDSGNQPLSNTLDVQIKSIRKMLVANESSIKIDTLQGFGYVATEETADMQT